MYLNICRSRCGWLQTALESSSFVWLTLH